MRIRAIPLVLTLCLAQGATAGTVLTSETRRPEKTPRQSTLLADGERLRLDPDGSTSVVYRADRGVLWLLDHRDRTFLEVDQAQVQSVGRALDRLRESQRAELDKLPPEQREQAERLLDGDGVAPAVPDIEVRETGGEDRVAGIPCAELEVYRDQQKVAELCRASYADAGVPRERFAALLEVATFLRESAGALAPEKLREGGLQALGSFAELEGLPLRVRAFEEGELRLETEVVAVEERPLEDASFEVPPGYSPRITIKLRKGVGGP